MSERLQRLPPTPPLPGPATKLSSAGEQARLQGRATRLHGASGDEETQRLLQDHPKAKGSALGARAGDQGSPARPPGPGALLGARLSPLALLALDRQWALAS